MHLGLVEPKATAVFTMPAHLVTHAREMEFLAASAGHAAVLSQRFWVGPGERVELRISQ